MTEIALNLYIGTVPEIEVIKKDPTFRIVSLAHNYHYLLHKWEFRGKDYKAEKCYVIHEDPQILSVNWVDAAEARFFDYNGEGIKTFQKIFHFINKFRGPFKVVICCNKGESRAPSVAMAYMAKCTDLLSTKVVSLTGGTEGRSIAEVLDEATKYEKPPYGIAREKFDRLYPGYYPGQGITQFLIDHWAEL